MKPKQDPISIYKRKLWVFNVVLVLFPKMMRLLLQSFITPRGLLIKYNNGDVKVALTDKEKSDMEKLPKMTEFTIELCYKILRFEKLVPKPSSQWEVPPDEDHQVITDDIKRIVFNTNDVLHKQVEDISNTSFETFKATVEGIVDRIDLYLGVESCKQWYEEDVSFETDIDSCMTELQKMREIDFTGTTTSSLSDMEIENGERFARIGCVILDIFPKILRAVIQMKIAPDVLYTHCSTPTHWGRFKYEDQNKLKSLNSSNTYDLLDIPLVYRLLRQFSLIKEPTNGWGQIPSSSDISTGDDIERIRCLRNNFAHRIDISTTQTEFDDTFSTFKDICRRMDLYLNNNRDSGYENDVSRKETTPMDYQLQQKYQRSLQELENIKLRFIEPPVKFYWGEAVEISLKNLRQVYKDEKDKRKDIPGAKLRLQIVVQNIEDESVVLRLVHKEFKDDINTEFSSKIKLIKVSKGSIILHVDILQDAVCSEESFQLTLVQFVHKVLQIGDLILPTIGSTDVVLVPEDEYSKMQLFMQESVPQLCFDFEIETSEFETDTTLKAKLGETVTTMLKHSNGKGQISDVSATILSDGFGQTDVFDTKDLTSVKMVKMEITDEGKYEEILLNIKNLKCLIKLKGLPNDTQQTEVEGISPDIKGYQLFYVELTMECPHTWNITSIASTINDNSAAFHDEINIDCVYIETNWNLVLQTTMNRYIFRSKPTIEAAVKKFLNTIINVCSLELTEPEELSVSALIMTKPEEEVKSEVENIDDCTMIKKVKMEITDDAKYEDIFIAVDNLKCLLKLTGLPNDLLHTAPGEKSSDVKGNQLLYVEWTMECPLKWNVALISSSINDNLYSFHDEFSVDYVYSETSSKLIIHTTVQRCVFRSYSTLEVAVKNLIGKIINVASIKSTEPEELSVSVLIMTKPEDEAKSNKEWKTDKSISGLKDNIVTCDHCTQSFSCKNCTSKINHIRRLDKALKMKDQTIQRLEKALTKREKEAIEEDESDYDSYYSAKKNTINEEPIDYTGNPSTREIEMSEEPDQKKRKTGTSSEIEKLEQNQTEDGSKSLNHLVVDMKQALQKLGEIPLLDNCIAIYRKYMKNVKGKWTERTFSPIQPKNEQEILANLLKEKKKRTKLIAKLRDVIHNQDEFTTTDEGYGTDIRFLDVDQNPATKCTYCHNKEASQISWYDNDLEIFVCDNCLIEHRMKNRYNDYFYQTGILREYELTDTWGHLLQMIDMKFVTANIVAILQYDKLCTYNFVGELINSISFSTKQVGNSRIACINNYQIAVTEPVHNLIKIVTIIAPNTITHIGTPAGTNMTGGITYRMDMLYVAFNDAIRLMGLSGQIQRVVNIPIVDILHYVNNDKMLCVYKRLYLGETMSCLDCTNYSVYHFERFPFHPEDVTTDDVGNIIFIAYGVIMQADSDGKNIKIIMSPIDVSDAYENIIYNKDLKCLLTYNGYTGVKVYRKLE